MTAGRASERSDERKREVTGTVRFNPCDGVDADSRAVAGYSRDQRPTSRVREAGFGPQTCHVTCAFGFVVPRDSNPCLHLERLSRAESVTCGERWKVPLTGGFRSWSILVATPRFSMSCGIDTGSKGVAEATTTFTSVFGRRGRAEGVREPVLA